MTILEATGARWESHPGLRMRGEVIRWRDGTYRFTEIECLVELRLLPTG